MTNTDMVLFQGDGTITDLWSTTFSRPSSDDTQDYEPNGANQGTLADGVRTFETYRALDTGDSSQDQVIACGQEYDMAWTLNSKTSVL